MAVRYFMRTTIFWLQRVRVCCSVLQCVVVCCRVLHCVAVCDQPYVHTCVEQPLACQLPLNGFMLQCVAVCCSMLQYVAVCRSVLVLRKHNGSSLLHANNHFFVATCDSVLECVGVCWSVLECVVVCCRVLQGVALCCSM